MATDWPDTFDTVVSGLERAGWASTRASRGGRYFSTAICHGGASPKLWIVPRDDGGYSATCWTRGCKGQELYAAIRDAAGLRSSVPAATTSRPSAVPSPAGIASFANRNPLQPRTAYPRHLWALAGPIPVEEGHPARRWLAARRLWRPGFPLPDSIRWLPAKGAHLGAGSLLVAVAAPVSWAVAWPDSPAPVAVQLVSIDTEGHPALDRSADTVDRNGTPSPGLSKRTYGPTSGAVVVLGNPLLADASDPVRVAEGLADAMGLAARFEGAAVATLGTSGLNGGALITWLASSAAGVCIHADADADGIAAARRLVALCQQAGGNARAVLAAAGKDAADAAQLSPFEDLGDGWIDFARTLRETTTLPRWECARLASIIFSGPENHQ